MRRLAIFCGAAALACAPLAARAQDSGEISIPQREWSFDGIFGTFDRASAQRGFQVYNEVCSNCHSLKEAYYRDLAGIGLSAAQITAIAASKTVPTIGDDGQPTERPALPSDHFKAPFPNEKAARAALNGALPPDQSVIVKAREDGANYIYALLNGYGPTPPDMKIGAGLYYNKYFPGHQIAMPQPLNDDQVTYADGTKATVPQMSADVVTFLTYIANPEMERRKAMGVKFILFMIVMSGLVYALKRKIWADIH